MRPLFEEWLESWLGVELPGLLIPNQAMMVGLGFLLAALIAILLGRRAGLSVRQMTLGLAVCFSGALLGSRVLGWALRIPAAVDNPSILLNIQNVGSGSFGAFAGGSLAYLAFMRWRRLDIWAHADAMLPAAALGMGISRLGCLLHGCDYGRMSSAFFAMRFPAGSPPYQMQLHEGFIGPYQSLSLPVLPLQLMLSSFDFALFALFALRPKLGASVPGQRALLLATSYFIGRFLIEFARSPHSAPFFGFLNLPQWMSVVGTAWMLALLRRRRQASRLHTSAQERDYA